MIIIIDILFLQGKFIDTLCKSKHTGDSENVLHHMLKYLRVLFQR